MYKTVQGDTWDIISKKVYGNEKYTQNLIEANFTKSLVETVVFTAGIELITPEINVSSETETPPWRR